MSNMKMTLPASRTSLETAHPLLTTLRAVGDVRYAVIESTENLLLVNSTSGELILNKGILENQGKLELFIFGARIPPSPNK